MQVNIKPPYNLTDTEVVVDKSSAHSEMTAVQLMRWFMDSSVMEADLERVFRSTVLLRAVTNAPFAECLDTALIWERG